MILLEAFIIPGLFGTVSLLAFLRDDTFKNFNIMLAIMWFGAAWLDWRISPGVGVGCLVMSSIYCYLILQGRAKPLKTDEEVLPL